jgi:oligopeptide transport system ATP-binding protein
VKPWIPSSGAGSGAAAGPLLSVSDLAVEFWTSRGTVYAVNGVSFDVAPGETLGIVGESGCGKSVTSLAILGILSRAGRVTRGQAIFEGRDLLKLSDRELRGVRGREIAMIFQDPMTSLNPVLTVGRQLRVAIALACEPKLLIADEPTTALDVTIQAQILALLRELVVERNAALIMITHDLGVVAGVCERVNVMYAGMFMETGTAEQLFHRPRHPYTLGLLQSVPRLDADQRRRLHPIEGAPRDMLRPPTACPFQPRCRYEVERSREEVPPLVEIEPGHRVACFNPVPAEDWDTVRVGAQ